MVDRDTMIESAAAIVAVLVFIAVTMVVGALYGGQGLDRTGAYALVAAIVGFVLLMGGVGVWLAYRRDGEESGGAGA